MERRPSDPVGAGRDRVALHAATLGALAITVPVLDHLGRAPTFFFVRDADRLDLGLFVALVAVGVPLALALAGLAGHRVPPPWGARVYATLLVVLVAVGTLPLVRRWGLSTPVAALMAFALGVAFVHGYRRWRAVRMWTSALAAVLLVAPLLFVLRPGIRQQLWSSPTAASPAGSSRMPTAPIVLVVFDELPLASILEDDTTIDATLAPHLAAFAGDARFFARTVSVSDATAEALPALLTGRYPQGEQMPTAARHPDNLFTLMGAGPAHVHESVTRLCPPDLCPKPVKAGPRRAGWLRLTRDASVLMLHRQLGTSWVRSWLARGRGSRGTGAEPAPPLGPSARQRVIEAFVEGIDAGRPQRLYYLHVLLPHVPFEHRPNGRRYRAPAAASGLIDGRVPTFGARVAYQRHLLQVGYADHVFGQIVDRLREHGLYDAATIAVVADHGRAFEPGQPARSLLEGDAAAVAAVAAVPWLIKAPGQRTGEVDLRLAETVDVLPTVVALAGGHVGWPTDGRSLASPSIPGRTRLATFPHRRARGSEAQWQNEAIFGHLAALVTRLRAWVCGDPAGRCPYAVGPHADLFGQSLAVLPTGAPVSDRRARIDTYDDPPVVVTGGLDGTASALATPAALALVSGDRIVGLATTESIDGPIYDRWQTVVDTDALATESDLTLYLVSPSGAAGPMLRALPLDVP